MQWPGGYLLSDYVLSTIDQSIKQPNNTAFNIFKGRRVVELGAGIGLTSVLMDRLIDCSIVCTDFEPKVLNNILFNLSNHQSNNHSIETYDDWKSRMVTQSDDQTSNQWSVACVDWTLIDESFLAQFDADCLIAAETTYIPELLVPFAETVACLLRLAKKRSINQLNKQPVQPVKEPFAILCQTERHPLFFIEYLTALRDQGLHIEEIIVDESMTKHFIYDRGGIYMHRVTLDD